MSIKLRNGKKKCQSELVKSYLRAYFKGLSAREECYCCRFRTLERVTDFTLGDCRNIGRYHKELDDDKGTTVVYVHSHKGQALLDMIKEKIVCVPLNINDIISTCGTKMLQNPPRNTTSYSFKKDIGSSMPYETLIRYYCPADIEERIATIVKPVIYKLRLHKLGFLKKLKGF